MFFPHFYIFFFFFSCHVLCMHACLVKLEVARRALSMQFRRHLTWVRLQKTRMFFCLLSRVCRVLLDSRCRHHHPSVSVSAPRRWHFLQPPLRVNRALLPRNRIPATRFVFFLHCAARVFFIGRFRWSGSDVTSFFFFFSECACGSSEPAIPRFKVVKNGA